LAFSEDGGMAWIGQPIWKLEEKYKDLVKDLQTYVTPGMLGIHIVQLTSTKSNDTTVMAQCLFTNLLLEHCCFY